MVPVRKAAVVEIVTYEERREKRKFQVVAFSSFSFCSVLVKSLGGGGSLRIWGEGVKRRTFLSDRGGQLSGKREIYERA